MVILGFAQTRLLIHPSKRILFRDTKPCGGDEYESSNDSSMEMGTIDEEFEAEQENTSIKKRQRTDVAINLIIKTRLSSKKTEIICKSLVSGWC